MKIEIKTNSRFDTLTNLDISTHYQDREYWFLRSNIIAAFAYWVVAQSPYDTPDTTLALQEFGKYVSKKIEDDIPKKFSYSDLKIFINEKVLKSLPEVAKLNNRKNEREGMGFCSRYNKPDPDDDFIDLGALARNIFYMILREDITQR